MKSEVWKHTAGDITKILDWDCSLPVLTSWDGGPDPKFLRPESYSSAASLRLRKPESNPV